MDGATAAGTSIRLNTGRGPVTVSHLGGKLPKGAKVVRGGGGGARGGGGLRGLSAGRPDRRAKNPAQPATGSNRKTFASEARRRGINLNTGG